jgi:hypothetical protein
MEAIQVNQRLRPVRYAFIVNEGDAEAALAAVSLNTVLWGGIYNPIVPLTPQPERETMIAAFDPDAIINLTGAELDPGLAERYRLRILTPDRFVDRDRGDRRRLAFGFDILPLLRQIYETEVRHSAEPTRAVLVRTEAGDGWPEYVSFAFGTFARIPALDTDFADVFRRALRARELVFDPENLSDQFADILSPIETTGYALRVFAPPAAVSSHILYVGDHRNWADLITFWNLRATGRKVLFIAAEGHERFTALIRAVAAQGRYPINPQIENEPDLQKAPSINDGSFERVCDSIAGLEGIGPLSRRVWQPRFGRRDEFYPGDIDACALEAKAGEELSILQEGRMTPVKLISPDQLDEDRTSIGDYEWAIDMTMLGGLRDNNYCFAFPQEPAVDRVVRGCFIGGPGAPRLGRHGVVILHNSPRGTLYPSPVETQKIFGALFHQVGLEMEPSRPGRYASEIIRKMGRLHSDCRVFKLQGVREVLDRLSHGGILTKGNIHDIVMSPDHWRPDFYERVFIRAGQGGRLNFTHIFEFLLEKRVIRPGFKLSCRTCHGEEWYHVSEFSEEYTCRFCFSRQRVNFASARDWQYKADGLFQIRDSALGSLAVVVSLWRFEHLNSLRHGRYETSINVRDPKTGWASELDYAYLVVDQFKASYELVLGQAAKGGAFTAQDSANMKALADRLGKRPWLSFATLRENFSGDDKRLLNDLIRDDYRVIALTRLELDPYDLYDRFAGTRHQYAVTLRDLSENTRQLNLS